MMIMTIQLFYKIKIYKFLHTLIVPWYASSLMVLVSSSSSYKLKWNCKYIFSSYLANVVHWEFLEGREKRSEKDHNLKIKSDEFMTILWWWFYDGMMIWWRNDFLMMIPLWGEVCWCWCTPRWGKSRRRVGTDCAIGMGTKMFSLRDCPTRGGGTN